MPIRHCQKCGLRALIDESQSTRNPFLCQRCAASEKEEGNKSTATVRKSRKNCVHHWQIDTPNGRESRGVCKRCGVAKKFSNSNESVMWELTNTLRADRRDSSRFSKPSEIVLSDDTVS